MTLLERFSSSFIQLGQPDRKKTTLPLPRPEIINVETHPLRFYPGFDKFVEKWNTHATADARMGLQKEKSLAQFELDQHKISPQISVLEERLVRLRAVEEQRRTVFIASRDLVEVSREEKHLPLKRAVRGRRRTDEKLKREEVREKMEREVKKERLNTATASLVALDEQFALNLDEDGVTFYTVERLRNYPKAYDLLLLKYCAKQRLNGLWQEWQELFLSSANYRFFLLLRYYDTPQSKKESEENLRAKAHEATARQLRMLDSTRLT